MPWVLINRCQQGLPDIVRSYQDESSARRGMRTSNRNAGWQRVSRCGTAATEMEWCRHEDGSYDHAPYVIMNLFDYRRVYYKESL